MPSMPMFIRLSPLAKLRNDSNASGMGAQTIQQKRWQWAVRGTRVHGNIAGVIGRTTTETDLMSESGRIGGQQQRGTVSCSKTHNFPMFPHKHSARRISWHSVNIRLYLFCHFSQWNGEKKTQHKHAIGQCTAVLDVWCVDAKERKVNVQMRPISQLIWIDVKKRIHSMFNLMPSIDAKGRARVHTHTFPWSIHGQLIGRLEPLLVSDFHFMRSYRSAVVRQSIFHWPSDWNNIR